MKAQAWPEGSPPQISTAEFNHPNAFKQSIAPEGQLVLIEPNLKKQAPNREGSRDLMVALVMVWLFLFPFCRFVYFIEGVRNLVEKH